MKLFSKKSLIIATVAALVSGIAFANKAENTTPNIPADNKTYVAKGSTNLKTAQMLVNLLRNPHLKVQAQAQFKKANFPKNMNDPVYTAHGRVDKKTAALLINLLRNPHLKVKAEAHPAAKPKMPQKNDTTIRYSVSGTTDKKTIQKLQALLKNSKHVNITIQADKKNNSKINLNAEAPKMQQYLYQDYSAIIAQGRPFYHNGRPPVFIQGSTLWYPVPVTTPPPSSQVQKISE